MPLIRGKLSTVSNTDYVWTVMIMEMNSMNMIRYHALLNTCHFLGGNGLKNFCEPIYDSLRRCLWEKAGWLISAAGSEDDKITQEGSATYQV